jgi:cell wall-associated NlpC family hydrolase
MTNILEDFTKSVDPRTSLFDVKIDSEANGILKLSGRVLDKSQLDELPRIFPTRNLDTASIRILNAETHERVHVTTNLTGLYERPTFGMALSSELTYGTDLEVLDERGKWVFTRQRDGYLGWAYRPYLGEGTAPEPTHLVLGPAIELRLEPDETSGILTRLVSGTGVACNGVINGWENERTELSTDRLSTDRNGYTDDNGCTDGANGWVYVRANQTGWVQARYLRALRDSPKTLEEKRAAMIQDFQRMIGVPYLWGGTSGNGIDCSGFARLLHRWVGVDIPRDADMQHAAAKSVEPPYEIGDLFFFAESDSNRKITHVGVSLGGWNMVHSSRTRNGVYVDDLQKRKDLMDIFVSAGSFLR